MRFVIQWHDGTRTTITCEQRDESPGATVLRTRAGLADVVIPRRLAKSAWPAGSRSA